MPKSKTRKRNGRPVRMARPGPKALVTQRAVASLCDDLDDLIRAVPLTYNPTSIVEALEHHHHATAVVDFLRRHDVVSILAAMGGGDMIALTDGSDTESATVEVLTDEGQAMYGTPGGPYLTADPLEGFTLEGTAPEPAHPWTYLGSGNAYLPDANVPCRIMPTRGCPPVYDGLCGDRPCARFESEDEAPWIASGYGPTTQRPDMIRDPGAALAALGGLGRLAPASPEPSAFATDTATLERIVNGLSDQPETRPRVLQLTRAEQNVRTSCGACGRAVALFPNGRTRRHKDTAGKWCVGS